MFFTIGLIALAVLPQDHSNGTWWEVRHAELSKLLPQAVCFRREPPSDRATSKLTPATRIQVCH